MKKLCSRGTVHPSPPTISDHLAFLPHAILTLTAALSPQDREVLAYLISCSSNHLNVSGHRKTTVKGGDYSGWGGGVGGDHRISFNCNCFRCYMSYWVRWDLSPNRQLIHEIIDAYEDWLVQSKSTKNSKKERRKRRCDSGSGELNRSELSSGKDEFGELESVGDNSGGGGGDDEDGGEGSDKGSVRRIVSFIGERIWGVWGP